MKIEDESLNAILVEALEAAMECVSFIDLDTASLTEASSDCGVEISGFGIQSLIDVIGEAA